MKQVSVSILQDERFNLDDFLSRWKRARSFGLRSLLAETDLLAQLDEEELFALVREIDPQLVLRAVFDQSRKFGLSASRYLGLTFEISDLADILAQSTLPCIGGRWKKHNAAYVRERSGCATFKTFGSLSCDYWREALDGLIMGVGENERFTRHRSVGHGDSECLDILFTEEFIVPRVVSQEESVHSTQPPRSQKYGKISNQMTAAFTPVVAKFKKNNINLVLAGLSEGILYYRMDSEKGVLCGAAGKLMHDNFLRDTQKIYPSLKCIDVAPLAVYGGPT